MKKSLQNQQIHLSDALISDDKFEPYREGNALASATLVIIGIVLGMVILATVRRCDPLPQHVSVAGWDCRMCHMPPVAKNYREYIRRYPRVKPVDLAELVNP